MPDYIPGRIGDKIAWMNNFNTVFQANWPLFGFSAAEAAELSGKNTNSQSKYVSNTAAQAAAQGATAAQNDAIDDEEALDRSYAQRMQSHPAMTDALRAEFGITISDATPTPGPGGPPLETPNIIVDFSRRGELSVAAGTNPANLRENKKPQGVLAVGVEYALGGIPTDPAQWILAELDPDPGTPVRIFFPGLMAPQTVAVRAFYMSKKLKEGPKCDPVLATVTP